jgi:hypothetical protein
MLKRFNKFKTSCCGPSNPDDAVSTITLDYHAKQPRHWTEVLDVEPFTESRLEPNDEATRWSDGDVVVHVQRQDIKLTLLHEDVNAGIHLGLTEAILL